MRSPLFLAFIAFFAIPAAACVPPPGLSQQQWYAICGNDMEQGFARGFGGRQSHDSFLQSMYQMYRSAHPTYNPQIEQQQQQLSNTMNLNQQRFMGSFDRQAINRNNAFNDQMREKAWQQNEEMNYIQNQHCAVWSTDHTFCLNVAN